MVPGNDLGAWVKNLIEGFIASPDNSFNDVGEPAWDAPLVDFSSGADHLYDFYKVDVGEFLRFAD